MEASSSPAPPPGVVVLPGETEHAGREQLPEDLRGDAENRTEAVITQSESFIRGQKVGSVGFVVDQETQDYISRVYSNAELSDADEEFDGESEASSEEYNFAYVTSEHDDNANSREASPDSSFKLGKLIHGSSSGAGSRQVSFKGARVRNDISPEGSRHGSYLNLRIGSGQNLNNDDSLLTDEQFYRRYVPKFVVERANRASTSTNNQTTPMMAKQVQAAVLFADITNFVSLSGSVGRMVRKHAKETGLIKQLSANYGGQDIVSFVTQREKGSEDDLNAMATSIDNDVSEEDSMQGALAGEKIREMLRRYFTKLTNLVLDHGGDVIKFAGDAIIAMWKDDARRPGKPESVRDAVLRAVQCSFEIQNQMDLFDSGIINPDDPEGKHFLLRTKLSVSAGSTWLLCLGGQSGRWENLIAGDVMRQLGTVTNLCSPGQILVSGPASRMCMGELEMMRVVEDKNGLPISIAESEGCQVVVAPPYSSDHSEWKDEAVPLRSRNVARHLAFFVPRVVRLNFESSLNDAFNSENRSVTVLFVSFQGIEWDGENLPLRLNEALRKSQLPVFRNGGFMRQFLVEDKGVTLIAGFGIGGEENQRDSTAACAVRAATMIRDGVESISAKNPIRASIGITTGNVHIGNVGSDRRCEYTMTGDVVNLAARIMALGCKINPNGFDLLVDPATRDRVKDLVVMESVGAHVLKGVKDPIELSRINLLKEAYDDADIGGVDLSKEVGAVPFPVGREAEMDFIKAVLDTPDGMRRSRCFLIEAEMGMGVSILLNKVREECAKRSRYVSFSRGSVLKSETPLFAWRSTLYMLLAGSQEEETGVLGAREMRSAHELIANAQKIFRNIDKWLRKNANRWPSWASEDESTVTLFAGTKAQRIVSLAPSLRPEDSPSTSRTSSRSVSPRPSLVQRRSVDQDLSAPTPSRLIQIDTSPMHNAEKITPTKQIAQGETPSRDKEPGLLRNVMRRLSLQANKVFGIVEPQPLDVSQNDNPLRSRKSASTKFSEMGSMADGKSQIRSSFGDANEQKSQVSRVRVRRSSGRNSFSQNEEERNSLKRNTNNRYSIAHMVARMSISNMYSGRLKQFEQTSTVIVNPKETGGSFVSPSEDERLSESSSLYPRNSLDHRNSLDLDQERRDERLMDGNKTENFTTAFSPNFMQGMDEIHSQLATMKDDPRFRDAYNRILQRQNEISGPEDAEQHGNVSDEDPTLRHQNSSDMNHSSSNSDTEHNNTNLMKYENGHDNDNTELFLPKVHGRPLRRASDGAIGVHSLRPDRHAVGIENQTRNVFVDPVVSSDLESRPLMQSDEAAKKLGRSESLGTKTSEISTAQHKDDAVHHDDLSRLIVPLEELVPLFGTVLDIEWEDTPATMKIDEGARMRCAADLILLLIKFCAETELKVETFTEKKSADDVDGNVDSAAEEKSVENTQRYIQVIFDDFQFFDPESIFLCGRLGSIVRNFNVFVGVRTSNEMIPSSLEKTYRFCLGPRTAVIRLDAMSLLGIHALCKEDLKADKVSDEAVAFVYQKSNGIPLIAKQIIALLVERNCFEYTDSTDTLNEGAMRFCKLRSSIDLSSMSISDNFVDIMRSRVNSLSPGVRQVLKLASVLGSSFHMSTLVSVLPPNVTRKACRSHLRVLCKLDLITRARHDTSVYEFVHDHTRQLVYTLMPVQTKERVHSAVALYLEALLERDMRSASTAAWLQQVSVCTYHWGQAQKENRAFRWIETSVFMNYQIGDWLKAANSLSLFFTMLDATALRSKQEGANSNVTAPSTSPGNAGENARNGSPHNSLLMAFIQRMEGQCHLRLCDFKSALRAFRRGLSIILSVSRHTMSSSLNQRLAMCDFESLSEINVMDTSDMFNSGCIESDMVWQIVVQEADELASMSLKNTSESNSRGGIAESPHYSSPSSPTSPSVNLQGNETPSQSPATPKEQQFGGKLKRVSSFNIMGTFRKSKSKRGEFAELIEKIDKMYQKISTPGRDGRSLNSLIAKTNGTSDDSPLPSQVLYESPAVEGYHSNVFFGNAMPSTTKNKETYIEALLYKRVLNSRLEKHLFGPRTHRRELFLIVHEIFAMSTLTVSNMISECAGIEYARLLMAIAKEEKMPALRAMALGAALTAVRRCKASTHCMKKSDAEIRLCSIVSEATRSLVSMGRWTEEVVCYLNCCVGMSLLNNGLYMKALAHFRDFTTLALRCHMLNWYQLGCMNISYVLTSQDDAGTVFTLVDDINRAVAGRSPLSQQIVVTLEMMTFVSMLRALLSMGRLSLCSRVLSRIEDMVERKKSDASSQGMPWMEYMKAYKSYAKALLVARGGELWKAFSIIEHADMDYDTVSIASTISDQGMRAEYASWSLEVLMLIYKKLIELKLNNTSQRSTAPEPSATADIGVSSTLHEDEAVATLPDGRQFDVPLKKFVEAGIRRDYLKSTSSGIVSMASIDDKLNRVEVMIKDALSMFGVAGSRSVSLKWQHDCWRSIFAMLRSHLHPGATGDDGEMLDGNRGSCAPRCFPRLFRSAENLAYDPFKIFHGANETLQYQNNGIERADQFKLPGNPHGMFDAAISMIAKCGNPFMAGNLAFEAARMQFPHQRDYLQKYLRLASKLYTNVNRLQNALAIFHYASSLKLSLED